MSSSMGWGPFGAHELNFFLNRALLPREGTVRQRAFQYVPDAPPPPDIPPSKGLSACGGFGGAPAMPGMAAAPMSARLIPWS